MAIKDNLNIYWILSTSVGIWFLFIHSPPILIERNIFHDAPFAIHLLGAYSIYMVCMWNSLFTPSTLNGKAQPIHVWVGRFGMIAGIVGFLFGAFIAWAPFRTYRPDLGFAIGITVGGVAQMVAQYRGYTAIRRYRALKEEIKHLTENPSPSDTQEGNEMNRLMQSRDEALEEHILSMISLFAAACGIPAAMRIPDAVSFELPVMVVLPAFFALSALYGRHVSPKKAPIEINEEYRLVS